MADEPFVTINGVEITARMLAKARQFLAQRSPFNAGFYLAFDDLSAAEQEASVADARNHLRALIGVLYTAGGNVPRGLGCSLHGGIALGTEDGGTKWIDCSPEVCGYVCFDHPSPLGREAGHICRPVRIRDLL